MGVLEQIGRMMTLVVWVGMTCTGLVMWISPGWGGFFLALPLLLMGLLGMVRELINAP